LKDAARIANFIQHPDGTIRFEVLVTNPTPGDLCIYPKSTAFGWPIIAGRPETGLKYARIEGVETPQRRAFDIPDRANRFA
jgi:hypothetical protein